MSGRALPFVSVNVAITADGKIAPADRAFTPFTAPIDHQRLLEIRSRSDAVMSGARTVENGPVDLGPGGRKYQRSRLRNGLAEFNLRVIVSGSASVNPGAHIFTQRFSPILLITSKRASQSAIRRLAPFVDGVFTAKGSTIIFEEALEWLSQNWKVKTLVCEGGGEVNAALFEENLVDKFYLTIAPRILAGRSAPTAADGTGIRNIADARAFKLRSSEQIKDELYCEFERARP